MGPERKLETWCVAEAHRQGGHLIKVGTSGWPDRMLVVKWHGRGAVLFIEFKQPGKVPTKRQEARHAQLRDLGQEVYVIDNKEDFVALFG